MQVLRSAHILALRRCCRTCFSTKVTSSCKVPTAPCSDIDLAVVGKDIDYDLLLTVQCEIDDLEMLYSIDLLDYQKQKGTPIGDHIDRVGQVFYEVA